jgi:hypothetical protein
MARPTGRALPRRSAAFAALHRLREPSARRRDRGRPRASATLCGEILDGALAGRAKPRERGTRRPSGIWATPGAHPVAIIAVAVLARSPPTSTS